MRHLLAVVAAIFIIGTLPGTALADLDSGQAAFDRGDFAAAHATWTPLAERADRRARFGLGLFLLLEGDSSGLEWIRASATAGYLPAEYERGRIVIEPRFVQASAFAGGLAVLALSPEAGGPPTLGYIDRSGAWAIEPRFSHAGDFDHDLALVIDKGEEAVRYINQKGKTIYRFQPTGGER